ncbi:MAG TPA: efflux RND transporter periplasmic adaptor subunit [Bacteroidia bacterium]|jgi:RND family efflux transporter MFP subunit|nr:efflux RND transporter periplasmic adaptor subunit [Bacteroidia bacterium]
MKTTRFLLPAFFVILLAACHPGADKKPEILALEKQRDDLKKQRDELNTKIAAIETTLAKSDTSARDKIKNVSVAPITLGTFRKYVELQGRIDADDNISLSPQMAGAVTKINVKVGDEVSQGQLLAELDNKVIVQGIAELQNSMDLANTMYEKQKNLWDQKIGTEVQYLSAKNQKESLERKMASLQQQLELSRIKSPINGTVDAVDIRLGQMAAPGMQAIRVVNFDNLKVKGEVSEAFAGKIKKGDAVTIIFPDMGDTLQAKIDFAAKVINPLNRTFTVQTNLDKNKDYHPNMIAVLKIVDYVNPKAFVVPVNTIQHAQEGDFVIVADNGKAKKVKVKVGHSYNGSAEILDGLKEGDKIILKGFQDLNEGEEIKY